MPTFLMLGKYSMGAVKEISAARTREATGIIGDFGGEVEAMYALLGEYDLVLIIDLPGVKEAMKTSVELTKLLGIGFTTSPAVTMEEFDELFEGG